jgi:hypothetical protein
LVAKSVAKRHQPVWPASLLPDIAFIVAFHAVIVASIHRMVNAIYAVFADLSKRFSVLTFWKERLSGLRALPQSRIELPQCTIL